MASKTRAQIRTFVRTLLSEPTAARWTDSELDTYINDGLETFCNDTDCLEDISTDSQVAYQADYAIPTDSTKIKQVRIVKGNSEYLLIPEDLYEEYTGMVKTTNNPPNYFNYYAGKIRLRERPSTAAQSTTLSAAISSTTATSLTITSASGMPRMGRIKVDSEIIQYWNISSTTLSPCDRGVEGTTAATHSNAATVTLRDIWIYHNKKETLSSDTDTPTIPSQFHEAPAWYAASVARQKSKDYDLAAQYQGKFNEFIDKSQNWSKMKWRRKYTPK